MQFFLHPVEFLTIPCSRWDKTPSPHLQASIITFSLACALLENEAAVGTALRRTLFLLKINYTISEMILKSDASNLGNASVLGYLL